VFCGWRGVFDFFDSSGAAAISEPLTMSSQQPKRAGDGGRPGGSQLNPDRSHKQQPPRNNRSPIQGGQQHSGGGGSPKNSGAAPAANHSPRVQQQGTAPALSLSAAPATSNGVTHDGGAAGKPFLAGLNAGAVDFVPGGGDKPFSPSFSASPPPASPPNHSPPAMAALTPAAPAIVGNGAVRGWGPVPGKPVAASGGGWGGGAGASPAHAPPQVSS
jgi:hypothetical protein